MTVTVRARGQATIVDVEGQLTFESTPDLRGHLLKALKKKTPAAVLVNLGAVGYMDSSGIATLVEGLKAAQANQVPFGLCGLSRNLRNVLELVRLDKVFRIFASEDEALQQLAGSLPQDSD
ncbi:MAG: STAS domain-containing protein [Acidobacteria bacterium]|nr:STAS domain-containing protein [Acidobacteriota bacterium]